MVNNLLGDRPLVIDDEPALAQVIGRIAAACGFEVQVTQDPSVFTNAARLWHPSVILLDLNMPGTDGIQLLRMLAADKCAASIVLNSGADDRVLDAALRLGRERGLHMREALPKPMRADSLRERLTALRRTQKLTMSDDLAVALAEGQLFLEYQPKFDCRLAGITGAEALVRWQHPTRGIVAPEEFILLAEEDGSIRGLTNQVIAEAAKQIQAKTREQSADHATALAAVQSLRDSGKLDEAHLAEFARGGKFDETAVALSLICGLSIGLVERALAQNESERIIVLAKAAGMSWETTKAILLLQLGTRGGSTHELDRCFATFVRLKPETARKAVEYFRLRARAVIPPAN